jgi:hypothetical protein
MAAAEPALRRRAIGRAAEETGLVWLVRNAKVSGVLPVRRLVGHPVTDVLAFYA